MAYNSGSPKRDVVNHGQNGKGDAPRHKLNQRWRDNWDAIDWSTKKKGMTLKELHDEWEFRHGL